MDVQFWIWVIVIVITLIARAKKKPQQPVGPSDRTGDTAPPPGKAITFEDLLREIQGEKMLSKPEPAPQKRKPYDFVDYDDDLEEEEKNLEDVTYQASKDEAVLKAYEAAKKEAFNRPSLELIDQPPGEKIRFDHFKEYDQKISSKSGLKFLKELKNPEGFRKAVILSEILNRKY